MLKRYFSKTNLCWIALAAVVFTVVTVLINAGLLGSYYQITLYNICINIILAVSLNLIIGICGQFSRATRALCASALTALPSWSRACRTWAGLPSASSSA